MLKTTILVLLFLVGIIYTQDVCTLETRECSDGSFVGRDPNNNCSFTPCPGDDETNTTVCTLETRECSDGTFVGRDPNNNCSFTPCPDETNTTVCTLEARECPDGSFVGRDPNNNCSFTPCPGETNTTNQTSTEETQSESQSTQSQQTQSQSQSQSSTKTGCHNQGTSSETYLPGSPCNPNVSNVTQLSDSQLSSSCVYGTLLYGGYCACWSGAYGKNCEMGPNTNCSSIVPNFWNPPTLSIKNCYPVGLDGSNEDRGFCMDWTGHETCSSWGTVVPLSTLNPPSMDSANFDGGYLNISVSQPMVNGRADGSAYLNDINLNSSHPYCVYPLSEYIYKEVDGCKDIWRFSIPWNLASQCGWDIVNREGYRVYRGQVIIQNHEYLSNIQDCRFTQSVLRIKITFQLFVQVNFSSVAYNQPDLNSAITRQIVSLELGQAACLQITTTLNYPYQLSSGDLVLTPPGKFLNHTFLGTVPSCSGTGVCLQRWTTCLDLANGTCNLDGSYAMNFTKTCRSNDVQCPITASNENAVVDFKLTSENFCATISVDIGLYGSIKSYSDSTFQTDKNSFLLGQKACYLITINSDSNTSPYNANTASVVFSSLQLNTVTVRVNDNINRIYSSSNSSDEFETGLQTIQQTQGNTIGFCFTFSLTLINNLNCTGVVTITIGAEVSVDYSQASSNSNGKRFILASGEDTSQQSTDNTLTVTTTHNDNSGCLILVSMLFALAVLL